MLIVVGLVVLGVTAFAWTHKGSLDADLTPPYDDTTYYSDTVTFEFNCFERDIERLVAHFSGLSPDSAESAYVRAWTSFEKTTWYYWKDASDSFAFSSADTFDFMLPHYQDSVLYFNPWLKYEVILTWDISEDTTAENTVYYDSSEGRVHMKYSEQAGRR